MLRLPTITTSVWRVHLPQLGAWQDKKKKQQVACGVILFIHSCLADSSTDLTGQQ